MNSGSDNTSNDTSANSETWHIVQRTEGHCDIVDQGEFLSLENNPKRWGPFSSRPEAIAKRVGLIRSGKCLPK